MTLPDYVLGSASARGDKTALVEGISGRSLTYAELAAAVRRVGTGLANCGVGATDVVALCAANSIDFVVGWYAASSIGAIVTTLNPSSTSEETSHHLRRSGGCTSQATTFAWLCVPSCPRSDGSSWSSRRSYRSDARTSRTRRGGAGACT
jgi:acyl-CoA synthetase (AMP-forming)/AMP-acid ligase II